MWWKLIINKLERRNLRHSGNFFVSYEQRPHLAEVTPVTKKGSGATCNINYATLCDHSA